MKEVEVGKADDGSLEDEEIICVDEAPPTEAKVGSDGVVIKDGKSFVYLEDLQKHR